MRWLCSEAASTWTSRSAGRSTTFSIAHGCVITDNDSRMFHAPGSRRAEHEFPYQLYDFRAFLFLFPTFWDKLGFACIHVFVWIPGIPDDAFSLCFFFILHGSVTPRSEYVAQYGLCSGYPSSHGRCIVTFFNCSWRLRTKKAILRFLLALETSVSPLYCYHQLQSG